MQLDRKKPTESQKEIKEKIKKNHGSEAASNYAAEQGILDDGLSWEEADDDDDILLALRLNYTPRIEKKNEND